MLREQDRHFLWSLLAAIGIIFVWKGLWEGIYEIPYFGDPWVALFFGLLILTISGIIFKEFDPLGNVEKSINKVMNNLNQHPNKENFTITYYDKINKKNVSLRAHKIKSMEKNYLIFKDEKSKQEMFIPIHRVKEILYQGKKYWRQ